jgi:DNA-binding transcriptional MerR regulator
MSRTVSDRSHLSIGEVLSLLQDEFPDVTISKIRFLESQGLLDPERTPSGYRKFYDADIDRLRWILRQQRENFLPLKVIKDRLDEVPFDELLAAEEAERADAVRSDGADGADGAAATATTSAIAQPSGVEVEAGAPPPPPEPAPAPSSATAPAPSPAPGRSSAPSSAASPAGEDVRSAGHEGSLLDTGETTVTLTPEELARATNLTPRQIGDLERFGLITGDTVGTTTTYGEDALIVARTAAAFMKHGIEARHLRMYKVAAEREAGFLEQVIMPLLKQRNPKTREKALTILDELVGLGDDLRQAMLRHALRDYLERP